MLWFSIVLACQCDVQGTINGSFSCDQDNGNCLCKSTVTGQTCDQCKDEFFQFPTEDEAVSIKDMLGGKGFISWSY